MFRESFVEHLKSREVLGSGLVVFHRWSGDNLWGAFIFRHVGFFSQDMSKVPIDCIHQLVPGGEGSAALHG